MGCKNFKQKKNKKIYLKWTIKFYSNVIQNENLTCIKNYYRYTNKYLTFLIIAFGYTISNIWLMGKLLLKPV